MADNINRFADFQHTVELSILKPAFRPGDEVEVRLRSGGNWYRATVLSSMLSLYINVSEAGAVSAHDGVWLHECDVWDDRVSTDRFSAMETNGRWTNFSDSIRSVE